MADIDFTWAEIGGGKSCLGTIECMRELEISDRYIVTSVPVHLTCEGVPAHYNTWKDISQLEYIPLQLWSQCHIKRPVNVAARVVWLPPEQAAEYWRYLPAWEVTDEDVEKFGLKIIENVNEYGVSRVAQLPLIAHPGKGMVTDFRSRHRRTGCFNHGCYYIIDEAHNLFPARNYQSISPGLEHYQSQLRKLDDDLRMLTQHPEKVDKNCRRNATQWTRVQNMSRSVLWMGVTLRGNRFRYYLYQQNGMPDKFDKPTVSGWYSFDPKKMYHKLYHTMDGSGISGGLVKESSRVRGRSPLVWAGALVALVVFCIFAPRMVQGVIQHIASATIGGAMKGAQKGLGLSEVPPATAAAPASAPAPSPAPASSAPLPVRGHGADLAGQLYCKGIIRVGDNFRVVLSDGRIAYSENGEVQAYGTRYVRVFNLPPIPVRL